MGGFLILLLVLLFYINISLWRFQSKKKKKNILISFIAKLHLDLLAFRYSSFGVSIVPTYDFKNLLLYSCLNVCSILMKARQPIQGEWALKAPLEIMRVSQLGFSMSWQVIVGS